MSAVSVLIDLGAIFILLGICVIVLSIFLLVFKRDGKGKVSAGGAIIIGPIPIVFGTDKRALKTVLLLSIALTILLLIVMIVNYVLR